MGGNGTTGAIYGELTMGSFQRLVNYMKEECGLTAQSRFIDVGSGLGKPNFHVAQDPAVRVSIGAELELIRWQLAMKNLSDMTKQCSDAIGPETDGDDVNAPVQLHSSVYFLHMDIDITSTLNPFTHIYMYDLGFPPDLQQSIARKFNTSAYAEWFISYRPPHRVIGEYGYEVEFKHQMMTSMHGAGASSWRSCCRASHFTMFPSLFLSLQGPGRATQCTFTSGPSRWSGRRPARPRWC